MLQTLLNVFKVKELRNRVLFTLGMLVVFRIGHWIPLPGVNQEQLAELVANSREAGSALARVADFVSMFSGGALTHSTLFGLGIMPYITAGIIFQLLGTTLPQLKRLQEEGPTGRAKIQEWTRYATIGLCIVQAISWLGFMSAQKLIYPQFAANPMWWVTAVTALTAGTMFLMWLGEQIDKHGIGNGVSLIIMAGILGSAPTAFNWISNNFDPGDPTKMGWMAVFMLAASFFVVVLSAVIMTIAQRRIPIQQAKHTRGRKVFGGQRSYLPLRINHGGVMPIIFASSLMIFPTLLFDQIFQMVDSGGTQGFWWGFTNFLKDNFSPGGYLYVLLMILMVYFFSYFWITVQFNPEEMSKQLKESGSFILGLRPGPRTAEYLETVMGRITFVGAGFLAIIAVLPTVLGRAFQVDMIVSQFLGGTGLLIVVSVVIDFLQRIEANLLMRNYAGFLGGGGDEPRGPRMRGPR
jgi:preprotein translocase subunit SecY